VAVEGLDWQCQAMKIQAIELRILDEDYELHVTQATDIDKTLPASVLAGILFKHVPELLLSLAAGW
jgi:hypothetical protein